MLIVRGTKKLRDRVDGPTAAADKISTTHLGDWFATALFWRPQVALLVNTHTFVPVFMGLAPAATLLDRVPAAIDGVLRRHGIDDAFLETEMEAMADVSIAPTNDRSVLGVVNEFAFHGELLFKDGLTDLVALSLRMATTCHSVALRDRAGSPGPGARSDSRRHRGTRRGDPDPRRHDGRGVGVARPTDEWRGVPAQDHAARHQTPDLAARARRRRQHARQSPRGHPGRLRLVELPPPRVRGRRDHLRRP